jgi:exosome complex component RRP4
MMNDIEAHEAVENTEEYSDDSVKKRFIVVPGEVIVKGEDYLPSEGTRREGENIIASRFGLAEESGRVIKVISISGAFVPRRGNVVIGRILDITFHGWLVDIDYASSGFLPVEESPRFIRKEEMGSFLAIGDVISAKVWSVKPKGIDLILKGKGLGKLEGGFTFRVIPSRVPRIIGREGSMINLIKEKTGCNISVGQNGWIWIRGPNTDSEMRARKAIEFIVDKVQVEGLTEKMEEWFTKN